MALTLVFGIGAPLTLKTTYSYLAVGFPTLLNTTSSGYNAGALDTHHQIIRWIGGATTVVRGFGARALFGSPANYSALMNNTPSVTARVKCRDYFNFDDHESS